MMKQRRRKEEAHKHEESCLLGYTLTAAAIVATQTLAQQYDISLLQQIAELREKLSDKRRSAQLRKNVWY